MRKSLVLLAGAGLLLPVMRMKDEQNAKPAEEILRSYAADFRHDPAATKPLTFGVRVAGAGGGDWHVAVTGGSEGATQSDVALKPGFPTEPCAYFQLDLATLRRIDRGELNLLTAVGGRPREGAAPLVQLGATPRFQLDEDYLARLRPYMFHFWTRGAPERVPFRGELTQLAHGANAVVFYYQEGFRSAWYQLNKGQHINKDPADQTNPFPSMFIMVRGKVETRIGGKQSSFPEGEMMLVPAGVSHELWNPYEQPAEFIILMFGQGA